MAGANATPVKLALDAPDVAPARAEDELPSYALASFLLGALALAPFIDAHQHENTERQRGQHVDHVHGSHNALARACEAHTRGNKQHQST